MTASTCRPVRLEVPGYVSSHTSGTAVTVEGSVAGTRDGFKGGLMQTASGRLLRSIMPLALAWLGACETGIPTVCTAEFRAAFVTVLDGTGAPVPDALVVSVLVRTGEILSPTILALSPMGTYVILDDGARDKLRRTGDTVQVTAERPSGATTAAVYVFDVPGGCHIHKVSGPDTLTLQ